MNSADLTLDSSILGSVIGASGAVTCAITFSRLSATATPGAPTCDDATSTADPTFANLAQNDVHLQSGSPMRNAGNPAAPPAGALDFDRDPRVSGSCLPGAIQRDMGADETIGGGCVPATTQIDSGPTQGDVVAAQPVTGFPSPTFTFSSPDFNPTFECSVDGGAFTLCSSPQSLRALAGGDHTFFARARDASATADDTPASRTFTVDGTPPDTQIASGPDAGGTSGPAPTFGLTSEPGATFECSLDGAPFAGCGPDVALSGLADGPHVLLARAIDRVGNADPAPASRTWTVVTPPTDGDGDGDGDGAGAGGGGTGGGDTGGGGGGEADTDPPETAIRKLKVKGETAKVKFRSDEQGSTFECKLDKRKFKRCRSPRRLKNLDDGRHKFKVRAIDPAGNPDPSPAKRRFEVR